MNTSRHVAIASVWLHLLAAAVPGQELVPHASGRDNVVAEAPVPTTNLDAAPQVARWPALRYERPLRLLVVTEKRPDAALYRRIARRLRARIDYCYVGADDLNWYHVNDKWIEPKDNPTLEELRAALLASARESVAPGKDGRPLADAILLHGNAGKVLDDAPFVAGLLASARSGAAVVVCGHVEPTPGSALAAAWPCRPKAQRSWMSGGARRHEGNPAIAGVPVERLAGHNWIPFAEPAHGAFALANGESGATFVRRLDRGHLVAIPMGPISRKWDEIESLHGQYDHDEIWLRLWDHMLYELVRSTDALPAVGQIEPLPPLALAPDDKPGRSLAVRGNLLRAPADRPVEIALHLSTPQGRVVFSHTVQRAPQAASPSGDSVEFTLPVDLRWPSGLYPVYLTVGDPRTKRQWHQAMEFLPVTGAVSLAVAADQRGYRVGEQARFRVTAKRARPGAGELVFAVHDFRGRLLAWERKVATLGPEGSALEFTYRLADHGVRVDTYWATAAWIEGEATLASQSTRIYRYDRWSMRDEYQWSTWAGIACGPPATVPAAMRLMSHAGMNALGYPGRSEIFYPAERWGWRYYNEGIGMNTFSPVIEYENDAEIEAALAKEAQSRTASRDLYSAAFVLGSVGEEAGFKHGWGTRYYWDAPVAPEKACRALQWFLKQKYPGIQQLNATWRTNYRSWDEVKLTKEFSGRDTPHLEADGWARPKDSPLGPGVTAVSLAPYADTAEFYNWYYDRIVAAARRICRERINPRTLAMSSAPTIGSADYDVRQAGPGAWNESQWHSLADGPEPGFGLIWGHFDWQVKTDNMFWGYLLMRSGHNNYWVDVPLMFNPDLTHTRASFAMRRWTHRLAGHERIVLDSRPPHPDPLPLRVAEGVPGSGNVIGGNTKGERESCADVGLLEPNGLGADHARRNMSLSVQAALAQGGFSLPTSNPQPLEACKLIFAIGHQAVSADEARRLDAYVQHGGTLVFTPRFACQTEHGGATPTSPAHGLAARWGLEVTERVDRIPQYHPGESLNYDLDPLGEPFRDLKGQTLKIFRERVRQEGWQTLAAYADGTPALLARTLGKGRLVYWNAVYPSHHYIQWVTPTGVERQAFYRIIERLCEQAGVRRWLRLEGRMDELLHVAVKQFADPTGDIRYAIVRTSGEVPAVRGTLQWLGAQTACYDVLGGEAGEPSPRLGRHVPLNFAPGAGKLLAFTSQPVHRLAVAARPSRITAGDAVTIVPSVLDEQGRAVPGAFPWEIRVERNPAGGDSALRGLDRSVSLSSGQSFVVHTALSDAPGPWRIRTRDGITGLSAETAIDVQPPPAASRAAALPAWGWPSEIEEPAELTDGDFVALLDDLASIYLADHGQDGWMAKQRLGYFYDQFPKTRHACLRPLNDVDWPAHAAAIRRAIQSGGTWVLTGEDVNLDPASGLSVYPHHDGRQLAAVRQAVDGAAWARTNDADHTRIATLGMGRLILCRQSIDAAGHDNASVARWHQQWRSELQAARTTPIATPSLSQLRRWWRSAAEVRSQ